MKSLIVLTAVLVIGAVGLVAYNINPAPASTAPEYKPTTVAAPIDPTREHRKWVAENLIERLKMAREKFLVQCRKMPVSVTRTIMTGMFAFSATTIPQGCGNVAEVTVSLDRLILAEDAAFDKWALAVQGLEDILAEMESTYGK